MGVSSLLAKLRLRVSGENHRCSKIDNLSVVLDELDQGVALYSRFGELEHANTRAKHLEFPEGEQLRQRVQGSSQKSLEFIRPHKQALNTKVVSLDEGFALISNGDNDHTAQLKKLASHLANDTVNANPFALAARALGLASQWRWVGITWFCDQPGVGAELRGFWDRVSIKDVSGFDIRYPQALPKNGDTVFLDSADSMMPPQQGVPFDGVNIKAFAGQVYSVSGVPQGELFLLDTDPHINKRTMQAMLAMVAGYLETKLQQAQSDVKSSVLNPLDLTDSLTQFGNKHALNTKKRMLSKAYLKGDLADVLVVDIELRRAVHWQQSRESASVVACAEVMRLAWPTVSCLFRPDEDRFVFLIPGVCVKEHVGLLQSMDDAVARLEECDEFAHDLAYGLSFLSQNNGKLAQTELVAAEQRQTMYFEQLA